MNIITSDQFREIANNNPTEAMCILFKLHCEHTHKEATMAHPELELRKAAEEAAKLAAARSTPAAKRAAAKIKLEKMTGSERKINGKV